MAYKRIDWTSRIMSNPTTISIKATHPMDPIGVTVHNTANSATARNEGLYMIRNSNYTSYHVAIDDIEAVELVPFNRNAWHAGDGQGRGNRRTIGIEICHSTGDPTKFQKAEENAAEYIAYVLHQYGWTLKNVYRHQDWSGKYCPHKTMDKGWQRFLNMIQKNYDEIKGATKVKEKINPNEPSDWAKESWEEATKAGIVDGTRPKDPITREEYAASELRRLKQ